MRYFLCILLLPIAVLTTGRFGAFLLSLILSALFWISGIIYAILVTNKYYAYKRHKELLEAQNLRIIKQ
ncbi:MAG: YqaE/Pmp3 family membrane protein [Bacteroidetes bacterium]|nr:YqaE/Pmp3 family membrane protein [Bacteroidota bacterium]